MDKTVDMTATDVEMVEGLPAVDVDTADKARLQQEQANLLGIQAETHLTVRQALSYYRKAVAWSVVVSMATVMESYDLTLLSSFYAFPQFKQKYGERLPDGTYTISSSWQIGLSMAYVVGMIPGIFASGWLVDRFGYRRVMAGTHVLLTACIFAAFFASSVEVLLVACLLIAFPCGIFAAATPGYAAEICPMALRGYLTTYVNLCFVIGHIIAAGVLRAELHNTTAWSYRIPYAIQWVWPPFLAVACLFAPETPWWYVQRGQPDKARDVLDRRLLSVPDDVVSRDVLVAMMDHTLETERAMRVGSSYADCFRGTDRRRTEIAMISWGCQVLPGFGIQAYTTYFFSLAGLSSSNSFNLAIGTYSIAFVGTVLSWLLQARFGRRQIYLGGLVTMLPIMLTVGFLDLGNGAAGVRWAQSALLLVWFFAYGMTIGPIPYAIAAEVGASKLRSRTIALGRNAYSFLSIINTVVAPYLLNPTKGNLKGKAAFPAAGLTLMLLVWAFFRLPETKGLTAETLDHLFHQRVRARKFLQESKKYQ